MNLEVPLRNGDLITASAKYYVTVEGEVARPGRYPIEEELTRQHGASRWPAASPASASNDVKVRRVEPGDGQDGRSSRWT